MPTYFAKTFAHNSGVCHYVIRRSGGKFSSAWRVWVTGSLDKFAPHVDDVFAGRYDGYSTSDRRKVFRQNHGWSAGKVHSTMPEPWWDDKALARLGYRRMEW